MNSKKTIYYSEYLSLDSILDAQHLESEKHGEPAHDEMLFIITHQTFELWFKQFLFELDSILKLFSKPHLQDEEMNIVVSRLKRIIQVQKLLIEQFDVLGTMSPIDFLSFRDFLIPASGFQSIQFKLLEKKLGIILDPKHEKYSTSALSTKDKEKFSGETSPSLLSLVTAWLERNPFLTSGNYSFEKEYKKTIFEFLNREIETIRIHPLMDEQRKKEEITKMEVFQRNVESLLSEQTFKAEMNNGTKKMTKKAFFSALFIRMYRHYAVLQMPYQILDLLIELNENHVKWKQRHVLIIQRMIGLKMGTGGTSGKDFLENTIRQSYIFSDLIEMPSYMIAPKFIPQLPPDVSQKLGYVYK